jgi:glycosyltransferase involved in cell wall biosynthesis
MYHCFKQWSVIVPSPAPEAPQVKQLDRWALRSADHVLLDTASHGLLYANELGFDQDKGFVVPVGAEPEIFPWQPLTKPRHIDTVLFYGSMIPLHGIETILKAASEFRREKSIRFRLVGTGQEYAKARDLSAKLGTDDIIEWIDSVPYERLSELIAGATICLGIFGTSEKARAVVPNKVFQYLSVGRPVISGDTAAMREWFTHGKNCWLVPPGDSAALAAAVRQLKGNALLQSSLAAAGHKLFEETFSSARIGHRLMEILTSLVG